MTNASSADLTTATNYWAFLLLIFPVFTIFGNVLVVLSVWREKNLQNATNLFIVSLAVADISLAMLVMPLASWVEINNGYWAYSDLFCDLFIMLDVLFCTSSILNLVAISLDRFVAVTRPIQYSRHNNRGRIVGTIFLTWLLSFCIALPIACGLNNTAARDGHSCRFNNADYIIYSSFGSFYIPAVAMIVLYYRIFRVIRLRAMRTSTPSSLLVARQVSCLPLSSPTPQPCTSEEVIGSFVSSSRPSIVRNGSATHRPKLSVIIANRFSRDSLSSVSASSSSSCSATPLSAALERIIVSPLIVVTDGEQCVANKQNDDAASEEADDDDDDDEDDDDDNADDDDDDKDDGALPSASPLIEEKMKPPTHLLLPNRPQLNRLQLIDMNSPTPTSAALSSATFRGEEIASSTPRDGHFKRLLSSPYAHFRRRKDSQAGADTTVRHRDKSAARKERKATKTLAIVLGVFLSCWLPFFVLNGLTACCIKWPSLSSQGVFICHIPDDVNSLGVWLGYINSFLNPIIYTIFNSEFRRAFKKLLHLH